MEVFKEKKKINRMNYFRKDKTTTWVSNFLSKNHTKWSEYIYIPKRMRKE